MRFLDPPVIEDDGRLTLAEHGDYWIDLVPMIFNTRVVMTPKAHPDGYDHGWCYPSRLAAIAAVHAWDPATMAEPVGYAKRATPRPRVLPEPEPTP